MSQTVNLWGKAQTMWSPLEELATGVQRLQNRAKTAGWANGRAGWPSSFQGQGTWPFPSDLLKNSGNFLTVGQLFQGSQGSHWPHSRKWCRLPTAQFRDNQPESGACAVSSQSETWLLSSPSMGSESHQCSLLLSYSPGKYGGKFTMKHMSSPSDSWAGPGLEWRFLPTTPLEIVCNQSSFWHRPIVLPYLLQCAGFWNR